jgi:MFS transporter, SP family, xylose:H+ symportor
MSKLQYWSLTVALSGFLFGFDTVVISGADKPIQALWQTTDWFHSTYIMSMALWGTVIGALFGGIPCHKYGRKKTLIAIGMLFVATAIGTALATGPYMFSFFRFLGGLGVGASSVAAPIYISEIAPPKRRGRLVALFQFMLVLGIVLAFISNWQLAGLLSGDIAWRWMLGISVVPAVIYTIMSLGIPESPRWLLLAKNDEMSARDILNQVAEGDEKEVNTMISDIKMSKNATGSASEPFFSKANKWPLFLAFMLAFFNQLSGINFILYYAPRIFEEAGISKDVVLLASIPLGIVNLIFTYVGLYLIDRVGRKSLMYIGSFGYILFLCLVAYAFYINAQGGWVVALVCGFIASHAVGQGAVIWVFISEIFPNKSRDFGMSWGSGTHWVFAAIITMVTLPALNALKGREEILFGFFAGMMVLQLAWVHLFMPETKGKTLEEI